MEKEIIETIKNMVRWNEKRVEAVSWAHQWREVIEDFKRLWRTKRYVRDLLERIIEEFGSHVCQNGQGVAFLL